MENLKAGGSTEFEELKKKKKQKTGTQHRRKMARDGTGGAGKDKGIQVRQERALHKRKTPWDLLAAVWRTAKRRTQTGDQLRGRCMST